MKTQEVSINKESIVFYKSFYEAIKELNKEQQAEVYNAIFEHYFNGKAVNLTGVSKAIFALVKPNIDSANKRYKNSVDNGAKGGRKKTQKEPRKNPEETQKEPKHNLNDNVDVNVNDNYNIYADFLNIVIKNWKIDYPEEFKRDNKFQPSYVFKRRDELEEQIANGGIKSVIDYVKTYHDKTLLEDGTFEKKSKYAKFDKDLQELLAYDVEKEIQEGTYYAL